MLELSGGHYLEMLKIRKQTAPQFTYGQLTKQMIEHKGLVGVLDGFVPWCVAVAGDSCDVCARWAVGRLSRKSAGFQT